MLAAPANQPLLMTQWKHGPFSVPSAAQTHFLCCIVIRLDREKETRVEFTILANGNFFLEEKIHTSPICREFFNWQEILSFIYIFDSRATQENRQGIPHSCQFPEEETEVVSGGWGTVLSPVRSRFDPVRSGLWHICRMLLSHCFSTNSRFFHSNPASG